jgi:hypothetical protein
MTLANALSQIRFVFAFRAAAFVAVCANAGQDKKQKPKSKRKGPFGGGRAIRLPP